MGLHVRFSGVARGSLFRLFFGSFSAPFRLLFGSFSAPFRLLFGSFRLFSALFGSFGYFRLLFGSFSALFSAPFRLLFSSFSARLEPPFLSLHFARVLVALAFQLSKTVRDQKSTTNTGCGSDSSRVDALLDVRVVNLCAAGATQIHAVLAVEREQEMCPRLLAKLITLEDLFCNLLPG